MLLRSEACLPAYSHQWAVPSDWTFLHRQMHITTLTRPGLQNPHHKHTMLSHAHQQELVTKAVKSKAATLLLQLLSLKSSPQ